KNISLSAGENIDISAGKDFTLDVSNKLNISSIEVKIEAEAKAEITSSAIMKLGAANTEVSGDALLTVKGGMVKIN
ncbi:hypothetical protein, partial [Rhizobium leguminosarum]|uniref:hypothetical protein n=1 Tax=Rhizobium leguminosarum TaxID=384 RepID=UPI003F9C7570